jgi:hypothetical protein
MIFSSSPSEEIFPGAVFSFYNSLLVGGFWTPPNAPFSFSNAVSGPLGRGLLQRNHHDAN